MSIKDNVCGECKSVWMTKAMLTKSEEMKGLSKLGYPWKKPANIRLCVNCMANLQEF
jgi:hypothetical protein